MEKVKRIKELVTLLNEARKTYEQKDTEVMTNYEYDKLYDELVQLEKESGIILSNSPTQHVGYEVVSNLPKEKHKSPMLSLDKTKEVSALANWLGSKEGVLSWKLDGLTVVLTYNNGSLIKAVTRGNGEIGELITLNARTFSNIPLTIPFKEQLVVRGEAVITYSTFNEINNAIEDVESKYKNPRNLCSGSVRQLDSKITASRNVRFVAFNLVSADGINIDKASDRLDWLSSQGFESVEYEIVDKINIEDYITHYFKKAIETNDIPSDGLVLTYSDYNYGINLGSTGKFPRHSIAFKWQDEMANTILREVKWSTSRTGLINPVGVFDEVELDGTTVSRATLHNLSIIEQLQLGIGDEIQVYKANMIIPKIHDNLTRSNTLEIPTKCPDCGGDVEIHNDNDAKTLHCTNPNCKAKLISRLTHFVSRDSMNIDGISEAILEKFVELGYLTCFTDIYELASNKQDIVKLDGFGIKSYNNMIDSIKKSKNVELPNFIRALGIPNIGKTQAKELAKRFNNDWHSFEKSIAYGYNFTEIDGFGDILNSSIHSWYEIFKKSNDSKLLFMVNFIKNEGVESGDKLLNRSICITGKLIKYPNRDVLVEAIEDNGGKVVSGVTTKTDFLLTNDTSSGSSKNKKAKELNIPIISEEQFIEMII